MKKIFAEHQAEQFLAKTLPVAKSMLCKDSKSVVAAAKKLKYPVVLKLISKDALHKTEIGGVKIVRDMGELFPAFTALTQTAKTNKLKIDGILVQEFIKGKEVMIGIHKDPAFGHVIAFGIGGTYVEVLKDVVFRACPINAAEANRMIDELKFGKLLFGARNEKPVSRALLVKTLVKVSQLPAKHKTITELDINPFMINETSGKVADARIVFG